MARPKPTFQITSATRVASRRFILTVIFTSRTDVVAPATPLEFQRRDEEDGPTFKARMREALEVATRRFDALNPEDPNDDPAISFPPDEVEVDV